MTKFVVYCFINLHHSWLKIYLHKSTNLKQNFVFQAVLNFKIKLKTLDKALSYSRLVYNSKYFYDRKVFGLCTRILQLISWDETKFKFV